jgi:tryptophan-rich sensory protein
VLVEVCFLWLSIVSLIIFTARHSRLAGVLLTPYLIWVSLASVLNFDVVRLNGPFG